jgi:hypothetical protein
MLAVAAIVLTRDVCRTHGRTVALWAAALYVGGCFALSPVDGSAANYAHFALPFATIALVWCRRGGWWPAWGGLMLGFAILSRQSWVFAVPAAGLSVWLVARIRGLALFVAATIVGVTSAALFVPWHEFWFWTFRSSPGFVFASIGLGTALARGAGALALFLVCHIVLVVGAGSTLPGSLRRHPDLWLWTLGGMAATAAGFRFYGHYWLQLVPPLVLLAAPAVAAWTQQWRRVSATLVVLASAVMFASLFVPSWFRHRHDPAVLAAAIRSCTTDDDRMFVWGSFPDLLYVADRPAAGGLVHSDFITGRSGGRTSGTDAATPGAQQKMMENLRAAPPALLVDTSGVSDLGYTSFPMLDNSELAQFATAGYTAQAGPNGFVVWWRNGRGPCPALTGDD